MISYKFDIRKVVQIINYLIKRNGGAINYTKLVKLLYIIDRRYFEKSCFNITTDSYASLREGPVTSTIYDLIKGENISGREIWDALFVKEGYDLKLLVNDNNLSTNLISDFELSEINKVDDEFKLYDFREMIDYTHRKDLFPEVRWEDANRFNTSFILPVEDILIQIGRSEEEITVISSEILSQQSEREFFKDCYC